MDMLRYMRQKSRIASDSVRQDAEKIKKGRATATGQPTQDSREKTEKEKSEMIQWRRVEEERNTMAEGTELKLESRKLPPYDPPLPFATASCARKTPWDGI